MDNSAIGVPKRLGPATRVMSKPPAWGLLIVLLLSFALRVCRLDAQSLWYDEAVTAQVAGQGVAELTQWTADDIQPPLYYYVVVAWTRLVGRGEWMLRFPSAFFSALTVPLLWVLALRLFGHDRLGQVAAWAAVFLGAVSPLYVYYAQEARMYAQLTFLGALAGYLLLRATKERNRIVSVGLWVAFVLVSVAMLYTHYFGAFLLLAYAICFVIGWLLARIGPHARDTAGRQLPAVALFSAALIVVLYLPWLPAMLHRYQVDRSYWEGSLKLVEALRHLAINFTTGAPETMFERDATRLLPWFGLGFGVMLAALAWSGRRYPHIARALLILLITLVLPAVAVLALASRTPKFNARYLMFLSPAYMLILGGGIGALLDGSSSSVRLARRDSTGQAQFRNSIRTSRFRLFAQGGLISVVAIAVGGFAIAASLAGVRNWFVNPAFTKSQWRELAASVRAGIAPDEAVLLVSGHAWPAWNYYAPDISAVRLPDIDILDVNAVLGFEAGSVLSRALRTKTGAWLVSWQEEAVDPAGFVPFFLDRAGQEQPIAQRFWQLGLRHWTLRPDAVFPAEPQPVHTDGANYAHQIALLGWDDPLQGYITIYWRALNPVTRDYQVSLVLEDATGNELGRWDGRPAGYNYPTFRWEPGKALFGRYTLPMPSDAPPGEYYVTIALYDSTEPSGLDIMDVADNPAGKRVRIGPLHLTR
jgi:mannosyltransferase